MTMQEPEKLSTISQIDEPAVATAARRGIPLRTASVVFTVVAFVVAVALFLADRQVNYGYEDIQRANDRNFEAENVTNELVNTSDFLTDRVRCYVATGERQYMEAFLTEVRETRRRDRAVDKLEQLLGDKDNEAYTSMVHALACSDDLVEDEYLAMRLMLEAAHDPDIPEVLRDLAAYDGALQALPDGQKREKARDLVFGERYMSVKAEIQQSTARSQELLAAQAQSALDEAGRKMRTLLLVQTILTVAMLAVVLIMVVFISAMVRKPLTHMVKLMKAKKTVPPAGAEALRFVTRTYNEIFEENQKTTERLTYEAMHDGLTGLFNRNAYELLYRDTDLDHAALLIVDVDDFKGINDTYGHDVGDKVLRRVAEVLQHSFRSVDQIYRIGGDEFVVIMTRANSTMRDLVLEKISAANRTLLQGKGDVPAVSLSVGVAFCDRENPQGDLLKDADTALYRVKEAGRCGCAVY